MRGQREGRGGEREGEGREGGEREGEGREGRER